MDSKLIKINSKEINDELLYEALISENFEQLVELQKRNEKNTKQSYFFEKINDLIAAKLDKSKYSKVTISNLLNNIKEKLPDYIISINDFTIEEKIGFGGNSVVYKGFYKFIQSAIKKVNLNLADSKTLFNVLNEILLLQKLRHPNIMMLLAISIDNNLNLYIITELYPKYSLQQFIENNKDKLQIKSKMEILFDIAKGLNYLHQLEPPILHRDLKPHNIFITSNIRAKIGDFGLAKEFHANEDTIKNTDTVSTLEYMSPETMNGSIYYKQSDIYSFGILAYEFLSEKYFIDKKGFQIINAILIKKYRPNLDFLNSKEQIKQLISSCWEDDWKMRPSFSRICEIITNILSDL